MRARTQGLLVVFTEILFGFQFTSSYLVQTEIQKLDGFENKTRGLVGVDVFQIPTSREKLS